jgi:2-keto-4-pentenoate hydratase/2-oxohepta-3-ene-1,7-dioic acid hydratase in catechol pathway
MKLYTFEHAGERRIGAEQGGRLVDLVAAQAEAFRETGRDLRLEFLPHDMLSFIGVGERALEAARQALSYVGESNLSGPPFTFAFEEVKLLAPIPNPGKVLCSGLNYHSHIEENPAAKLLDDPRFFAKLPNTVIGPGESIRHPGEAYQVDYEVELAVVIGRRMYRTPEAEVMPHVFGYTILHDVSSRYIQFKDNNEVMGKNFDTFCPLGPCIVTAGEIPDPSQLRLRALLNGEVVQDGTNRDWIFPLPRLLFWLSSAMTLEPGDLVSTGTPAGVGYFRNPQLFLKAGDVVTLEIEGIGRLENPVVLS